MKSWFFYYYHLSSFTVGIPIAYGYRFRKQMSPDLKALMRYLIVTLIVNAIMMILPYFMYNTVWADNCYLPIEVALTMWIFLEMQSTPRKKMYVMYAVLAFVILWFGEFVIEHNPFEYSEFSRPIEGLMFVIASTISIFEMQNDSSQLLTERPAFWTCAAFLIFYTPNVLLYFLTNTLLAISPQTLVDAMLPTTVLGLVSYLVMTKGLQCFSRSLKLPGASSS